MNLPSCMSLSSCLSWPALVFNLHGTQSKIAKRHNFFFDLLYIEVPTYCPQLYFDSTLTSLPFYVDSAGCFSTCTSPMDNLCLHLVLLLIVCSFPNTPSAWWFSSSPDSDSPTSNGQYVLKTAEFAMREPSGSKGIKIVEDARKKMAVPNSCWHNAYRTLFQSCSEIVTNEERKKRLAWLLSDCFQADSGRPAFPACKESAAMVQCLKRLGDSEHKVFLEFFMETNNICHQLQLSQFSHNLFLSNSFFHQYVMKKTSIIELITFNYSKNTNYFL